jgi:hypothetical protein
MCSGQGSQAILPNKSPKVHFCQTTFRLFGPLCAFFPAAHPIAMCHHPKLPNQ